MSTFDWDHIVLKRLNIIIKHFVDHVYV